MLQKTIKERIELQYNSLSKSQQKVANFVLNHPSYLSIHSASEVGKMAGTSETTVIRFCYTIGLEGYAQLQKEWTVYLLTEHSNSTLGNYVPTKSASTDTMPYKTTMELTSKQINRVADQMNPQQLFSITKKMNEAKAIYLLGEGASSIGAQWLYFTLNMLRPNVVMLQKESHSFTRTLQEVEEGSLAIVISLHRYYKDPLHIADDLRKRGVYTVGITDTKVSPAHDYTDETIVLEQIELSTIDLMPILISFFNALIQGMMTHQIDYYNKQRLKYDEFQNDFLANRWS